MRPRELRQVTDDGIHILDVVHHRAVWVTEAIVDGRLVLVHLRVGNHLGRIAHMRSINLAQLVNRLLLLHARGRVGGQRANGRVHKVVIAGQLAQPVLAAELVEPRHAVLAVADDIQRSQVNLLRRAIEPRQRDVLHELRIVVQRQQAQPLASQAEPPVGHAAVVHRVGGFALKGVDDRDLRHNLVRVLGQVAELDQVRHQRMQPVDRNKLLRKVERRAEVVHAAVDAVSLGDVIVRRIAAQSEDARPGREHRIPLRRLGNILGLAEVLCDDVAQRLGDVRIAAAEQTVPVGVHAFVQRLVVE